MTTIKLIENPLKGVHFFIFEDSLFLDTFLNLEIVESINIQELNDFSQIKQSAAINISLPFSKKNDAVFRVLDEVKVKILQDSQENENYNLLKVVKIDYNSKSYDCELSSTSNWIDKIQDLLIKDLDLGGQSITVSNLRANWTGSPSDYFLPLFFYGKTVRQNTFSLEDFRPVFYVKSILQKIFAKIGMNLYCDYLDTEHGNNLVAYILDKKWYEYENKGVASDTQVFITRALGTPVTITGTNIYKNIPITGGTGQFLSLNSSGYWEWNAPNNASFLPTTYNVKGFIDYSFPTGSVLISQVVEFGIIRREFSGNWIQEKSVTVAVDAQMKPNTAFFDEEIQVNPGDKIVIQVRVGNAVPFPNSTIIISNLNITFTPTPKHYIKNDIVNFADSIDKKLTAFNFIKGFLHLINGKIKVDGNNAYFLAAYNTQIGNDSVKGLYQAHDNYTFEKNEVIPNSYKLQKAESFTDEKKYSVLFKDSTDANIKALDNNEQILYAHIEENSIELENTLFEPSKDFEINPLYAQSGSAPIVPFLLDNLDLKISHKIAPRIFLKQGYVNQQDIGVLRNFKFEGGFEELIPYVSQFPDANIEVKKLYLTFGEHPQSYYDAFYKKDIFTDTQGDIIEITCMKKYDFHKNLHKIINIWHGGNWTSYIIESLVNYKRNSRTVTLNLRKL